MQKVAVALFAGIISLHGSAIAEEALLQGKSLGDALRQGGHVILIRHAASNKDQKDAEKINLTDCNTQRNLSREGQIDARKIGLGIDMLQIPVNKVFSSPFCRTMDTGRFAFSRVEPSQALNYAVVKNDTEKQKTAALIRPLLSTMPAPGTNTVLISHSTNIQATLGFVPDEGESLIFKPGGKDRYKLVGRVRVQQWDELK
jgi:phosphohistidine phosphatase SixA